MKKTMVVVVVLFIIFTFIPVVVVETASAFDPQSLIGEWMSGWGGKDGSEHLWLTIKEIKDGEVNGVVYLSGPAKISYLNKDLYFSGKLIEIEKDGTAVLEFVLRPTNIDSIYFSFTFTSKKTAKAEVKGRATSYIDIYKRK